MNWIVEALAANCANERTKLECQDLLGRDLTAQEFIKEQSPGGFMTAVVTGRADAAWLSADKDAERAMINSVIRSQGAKLTDHDIEALAFSITLAATHEVFILPDEMHGYMVKAVNVLRHD